MGWLNQLEPYIKMGQTCSAYFYSDQSLASSIQPDEMGCEPKWAKILKIIKMLKHDKNMLKY